VPFCETAIDTSYPPTLLRRDRRNRDSGATATLVARPLLQRRWVQFGGDQLCYRAAPLRRRPEAMDLPARRRLQSQSPLWCDCLATHMPTAATYHLAAPLVQVPQHLLTHETLNPRLTSQGARHSVGARQGSGSTTRSAVRGSMP
jgi:hypothetical protein